MARRSSCPPRTLSKYYEKMYNINIDPLPPVEPTTWVLKRNEVGKKLEPNWTGPYQVTRQRPLDTYELTDTKGNRLSSLVHRNRLISANVGATPPTTAWYETRRPEIISSNKVTPTTPAESCANNSEPGGSQLKEGSNVVSEEGQKREQLTKRDKTLGGAPRRSFRPVVPPSNKGIGR
jgi:hypothetical protein